MPSKRYRTYPHSGKKNASMEKRGKGTRLPREKMVRVGNIGMRIEKGTHQSGNKMQRGFVFRGVATGTVYGRIFYYRAARKVAKIEFRRVHYRYRKRGIGKFMLKYLERWLKSQGYRRVEADTRQPDTALFFLENGFRAEGIRNMPLPGSKKELRDFLEQKKERGVHIGQITFSKNLYGKTK